VLLTCKNAHKQVRPGESYERAAVREVFEETGIGEILLGRCVWTEDFTTQWFDGAPLHVVQRYYAARAPAGPAVSFAGHEPLEAATTVGLPVVYAAGDRRTRGRRVVPAAGSGRRELSAPRGASFS
jgi:ADP-ribose pyrophosphatase YjhB (NUDIX family)